MTISISELCKRSLANVVDHGWYETWPDGTVRHTAINVPEQLALIHSEISEALEVYRDHGVLRCCEHCSGAGRCDECRERGVTDGVCENCRGAGFMQSWAVPGDTLTGKPEGFVVELADAVLSIAQLCEAFRLDLAGAIEAKHAYNVERPIRHGGKRC